jgi:nicotinate-nucleotide adenylyltransferase
VLGGSFDPIHYGHLVIAEEARTVLSLNQVLFIPTQQQPLKPHGAQASANDRFRMVELACQSNSAFTPSAIEIDRSGPSYTVTTLQILQHTLDAHLFLILGADAAASLERWYNVQLLGHLATIAIVSRPTAELNLIHLVARIPTLVDRIQLLEGPHLSLSSTELRQRIRKQMSIRYLTPDPVVAYIEQQQLYRELTEKHG